MTYEKYLYKNGLPFTAGTYPGTAKDTLYFNIEMQKWRVERGKASLFIIDGSGLGEGKTTIGVHIADVISGKPIVFEKQLYMGAEAFIKGLKTCYLEKLPVIVYDESGDFDKRGALTRLNKTLGRVFDVYRAFRIIVILILPTFLVLDNSLFDKNLPRMLIHCYGRTERQGNFSVYDLSRMMWIRERAKSEVVKNDAYNKVQPNFRGHFKNLPPARSAELDRFSTAGKLEVVDLAEIQSEGLMTYGELAAKVRRTEDWVRRVVAKAKIKPGKVYKGKYYFGQSVLRSLETRRKRSS